MTDKKIKVLLEMRPALEGFAGIPQEVRLLFRGLRKIDSLDVEGMIQTSHKILYPGIPEKKSFFTKEISHSRKINRYSRTIVSLQETPYAHSLDKVYYYLRKKTYLTTQSIKHLFFSPVIKLSRFESKNFEDFVWRSMFSKTLPATDYDLVTSANFRINAVPWHAMQMMGLNSLTVGQTANYPRVDCSQFDIFLGQTPYPGSIKGGAAVVIRYHDALPIFMPHTIPDKSVHQASHFHALASNVREGAWFSCVSEATRQDLLKIFPEAESRSITIHNMVSHHYFADTSDTTARVPQIIRSRIHEGDKAKKVTIEPEFFSLREKENFYRKHLSGDIKYLLIVSTVEPRKNHTRLLAAWEVLKSELDPSLKLVIVGGLGWDYLPILSGFKNWIERGELFMLSGVPAPDLRVLYKHAAATVCPSLGEGFDFSGAEAMACGGVTVASDIPVHREIYDDAAQYFDPYSTMSLVTALKKVLYAPDAAPTRERMVQRGAQVVQRYTPEHIIPKWKEFLEKIAP